MTEEISSEKSKRIKATEGETVQVIKGIQKGKRGEVLVVRENSVIIKIGTKSTGEPIKIVVNHKNYKKVK